MFIISMSKPLKQMIHNPSSDSSPSDSEVATGETSDNEGSSRREIEEGTRHQAISIKRDTFFFFWVQFL